METQDTIPLKDKILQIIKTKGPCLPVHVANATGLSILFASAFLSELAADKEIKISDMKVGSSPVYFIPSHTYLLEKFSQHLKSKEKDAYLLLKENKFLEDKIQHPAIRVALRAIKDFAIPFENNKKLFWRYFTIPISEFNPEPMQINKLEIKQESMVPLATKLKIEQEEAKANKAPQKELDIFDKTTKKVKITKKTNVKSSNINNKFFNKVKESLSTKGIEMIEMISFSKSDLTLKVNKEGEKLLIAFNKKRINEQDILNAYKKAQEANLSYIILSLGEPSKKTTNFIEAIKELNSLEKIE